MAVGRRRSSHYRLEKSIIRASEVWDNGLTVCGEVDQEAYGWARQRHVSEALHHPCEREGSQGAAAALTCNYFPVLLLLGLCTCCFLCLER